MKNHIHVSGSTSPPVWTMGMTCSALHVPLQLQSLVKTRISYPRGAVPHPKQRPDYTIKHHFSFRSFCSRGPSERTNTWEKVVFLPRKKHPNCFHGAFSLPPWPLSIRLSASLQMQVGRARDPAPPSGKPQPFYPRRIIKASVHPAGVHKEVCTPICNGTPSHVDLPTEIIPPAHHLVSLLLTTQGRCHYYKELLKPDSAALSLIWGSLI